MSLGRIEVPPEVRYLVVARGVEIPERFTYSVPSIDGSPAATVELRMVDGQPICERLELAATEGSQPVTSVGLRRLNLGQLIEAAAYAATRITALQPLPDDASDPAYHQRQRLILRARARQRGVADPIRTAVSGHPRRLTDLPEGGLSRVADEYRLALARRERPTKRLMQEFHVSRSTASRWVRRARDAGLLDEPVAGR